MYIKTAEGVVGHGPSIDPSEIKKHIPNHTELMIAALHSLRLMQDAGRAREDLETGHARLSVALGSAGVKADVYPMPILYFDKNYSVQHLIDAFDGRLHYDPKPPAWPGRIEERWHQFGHEALNSTRHTTENPHENGYIEVRGLLLGGASDQPSLHLTEKKITGQGGIIASLGDMQAQYEQYPFVDIQVQNIMDIVVVDAMLREQGQPMLDETTARLVPHSYSNTTSASLMVGQVAWRDNRLNLTAPDDKAFANVGVGLSLGVPSSIAF